MSWFKDFLEEVEGLILSKEDRKAKQKAREAEQERRISDALWMSLEEAVKSRIWGSVDTWKLCEILGKMKKNDLEVCKKELESSLKRDVVSLVFWDYVDKLKWQDFFGNSIIDYWSNYLSVTDFWNNLANKDISFKKIGELFDKKILLSLQYWIQQWSQKLSVNIPFNNQHKGYASLYKVDLDDVGIEYKWFKGVDRVLYLIDFCRVIHEQLERVSSNDRKLWIFGDVFKGGK